MIATAALISRLVKISLDSTPLTTGGNNTAKHL